MERGCAAAGGEVTRTSVQSTAQRNTDHNDLGGDREPSEVGVADALDAGAYERPPTVDVPALPRVDLTDVPLPRSEAGRPILLQIPPVSLELAPELQDAVTAHGACLDLVTYCVDPPMRSLDACVISTPTCATARPWEERAPCCPASCRDAYEVLRREGQGALTAFREVYLVRRTCFPGLLEAIGRAP